MAKITVKNDSDQYIAFKSGVETWMIAPNSSLSVNNVIQNSEIILEGTLFEKLLKKQNEFTAKIIDANKE
jgi:hypothetical protein